MRYSPSYNGAVVSLERLPLADFQPQQAAPELNTVGKDVQVEYYYAYTQVEVQLGTLGRVAGRTQDAHKGFGSSSKCQPYVTSPRDGEQ